MTSLRSLPAMLSILFTLFSTLALAATTSNSARKACKALEASSVKTEAIGGADYPTATRYWSAANGDDHPACVAFPTDADQVSKIVKVLQKYTDVDFAMKSGGHNANRGFSSVDGGVLISFSMLASTTYNADSQTADIGPGSRWGEVCEALEPHGLTVVGGRIGDVGVGGLLLGGGLSFLSGQYGLPCDSVINYEVILSNSTIVNANASSNPDLFWALHGGGNQFGIVSKFTMKTFKIDQIWGGVRVFGEDKASALIEATHDFITAFNDPKAAVIVTSEITIDTLVEIWVCFLFYDGESPPDGVFDKFNAITPISDSVKVQPYASFLKANSEYSIYGFRYLIRGTTLPNLPAPDGINLYQHHHDSWKEYVTGGSILSNVLGLNLPNLIEGLLNSAHVYSMAFQPFPAGIPRASQDMNPDGNILNLDPRFGDHVWMEYDISWLSAPADDMAHAVAMNITKSIDDYAQSKYRGVKNTGYEAGDVMNEEYKPTFLNDAMYDQKPLQSYGESTFDRLKQIQKDYDTEGFFPGRTGGFKFN